MEIIKPQTSLSSFEVNKIGNEIRPKTDQNLHFSVKFTAGRISKVFNKSHNLLVQENILRVVLEEFPAVNFAENVGFCRFFAF